MKKCGLSPMMSDVTVLPGQVVVLAQAGEPMDISNDRFERFLGAEYRYYEWERLANRPGFISQPGDLTCALRAELVWLKHKISRRWPRHQ
jgi:hypothetical protein